MRDDERTNPYFEVFQHLQEIPTLRVHDLPSQFDMEIVHRPLSDLHRQHRGEATFEEVE